ncbi:hypothetical protein [Paenibacillus timonensis]|uniref:hypothetical protein n=1 Tax=Paenibacillus timonensis TaxID=225915 RepID=UPI003F9D6C54
MNAAELAKAYVAAAGALRSNTDAVMELIEGGRVNSPEFGRLWQQREDAFADWNNAALLVRDLPTGDMAVVVQEIEQMQAG